VLTPYFILYKSLTDHPEVWTDFEPRKQKFFITCLSLEPRRDTMPVRTSPEQTINSEQGEDLVLAMSGEKQGLVVQEESKLRMRRRNRTSSSAALGEGTSHMQLATVDIH